MTVESNVIDSMVRYSRAYFGKMEENEGGKQRIQQPGTTSSSTGRTRQPVTLAADGLTFNAGRWLDRGIPELASPLSD
jgi:hypothetical protein